MQTPLTGQVLDPIWFEPKWETWDLISEHYRSKFFCGTRFEFRQYPIGFVELGYGSTVEWDNEWHIDKRDLVLYVSASCGATRTRDYGDMPPHHVYELTNVFHRWPEGEWPNRVLLRSLDKNLFAENAAPPWLNPDWVC